MKRLQPYLIFAGNCEEALNYYASCLGGDIVMLQRYSESPLDVAEEHAARVFNSAFRSEDIAFMASDNLPQQKLDVGSNFSMFVTFSDAAEQDRTFEALARDGRVLFPLRGGFGMLEDRFRMRWMLALEEDSSQS